MNFPYTPFMKQALNTAIVFACLIVLHKPVELTLSKIIVEPIFSYINSAWYNDIIVVICMLVYILFLLTRFRKQKPSIFFLLFVAGGAVVYTYYRFAAHPWQFTSFYFLPGFKYADVLFIVVLVNGLLTAAYKKPMLPANSAESFFDDMPLGETQLDALGYKQYATNLSEKIKHSYFPKSFAIGINGKWGAGKTSFIDLLKRELKTQDLITVEFNPWNSHTPTAIIKDFFDTVREALQLYDKKLASQFVKYANKLVELNDNAVTKSVQAFAYFVADDESLSTLFKSINASLENINKKLIIYIDDLDRLDKEEILEVIRLIRNTANFHNTFFIVAYSKNYIAEALKDHNPFNYDQFLEKIFQFELTLPHFNKVILRQKLLEKLQLAFPESHHTDIQELITGSSIVAPIYLSDWIDTIRDVTRLSNSITLNIKDLLGEVEIKDFIQIEILRLKYPSVYELLFKKKDLFFKVSDSNNDIEPRYQLLRGKDSMEDTGDKDKNKYFLQIYLDRNWQQLGIDKNETEKIAKYVLGIFSDSSSFAYYTNKKTLSVVYASKFDRYFLYNITERDLSEIEFDEAIKLNPDFLNNKITEWVDKGLAVDVQRRLMHIQLFDSRAIFEKIIRATFYLANHDSNGQGIGLVIGYDGKDLYEKLSDYDRKLSTKLYADANGNEGLKTFIRSIFAEARYPFYYEAQFVKFVADRLFETNSFPLKQEELKQISLNYLLKFCEQSEKLERTAFILFSFTVQTEYVKSAGGNSYSTTKTIPLEAKQILRSYVLKYFDEYLLWIIRFDPIDKGLYSIEQTVYELFDGWDNFKTILDEQDETQWERLREFKDFFQKVADNNFTRLVSFTFKIIPIKQRTEPNN